MLSCKSRNGTARAWRADFLVAIDQYGQCAVLIKAHVTKHGNHVQNDRHALLVVRYAQTIGQIAINAEGLIIDHTCRVDRIHMRYQHDVAFAPAFKPGMYHRANLFRSIKHPVDILIGIQ